MNVEPGFTTTEFWASVVGALGVLVNPFGLHLDGGVQAALVTLIVTAYTLARTARKQGS